MSVEHKACERGAQCPGRTLHKSILRTERKIARFRRAGREPRPEHLQALGRLYVEHTRRCDAEPAPFDPYAELCTCGHSFGKHYPGGQWPACSACSACTGFAAASKSAPVGAL